jgi:hypothetical protein
MVEKLNIDIPSFQGILVYVDDHLQDNQCLKGRKSGDDGNSFIIVARNVADILKVNSRDNILEELLKTNPNE